MTTLQKLEANPEFGKYSYSDQMNLRLEALRRDLEGDEAFARMHPLDQKDVVEKIITRPPRFEDPSFDVVARDIYQKYKSEDPRIKRQIANWHRTYVASSEFNINQLLDKVAYGPLADVLKGQDLGTTYKNWHGQDRQKLNAWYHTLADDDYRMKQMLKRSVQIGNIVGYTGDIAAMYALTAGVGTLATGTTAAHAVDKAFASMAENSAGFFQGRLGQWIGKEGAGLAFRAMAEGQKDVMRDWLGLVLDEKDGKARAERTIMDTLKIFGVGAARDLGWALVMSRVAFPIIRGYFQVAKGYKTKYEIIRALGKEDFDKLVKMEAGGQMVPDNLLARASESMQDRLKTIRAAYQLTDNPELFTPGNFNMARVNAALMAHSLVEESPGVYRMRPWAEPNEVIRLNGLDEVNNKLSELLVKFEKANPPEIRAAAITGLNSYLTNFPAYRKYATSFFGDELSKRSFGTADELEKAAKAAQAEGRSAGAVNIRLNNKQKAALQAGGEIKLKDTVVADIAEEGQKINSYAYLRRVGDFSVYAEAQEIAAKRGTSVDTELRAAGFDAVLTSEKGSKIRILDTSAVRFLRTPATEAASTPLKNSKTLVQQALRVSAGLDEASKNSHLMSTILASGLQRGVVNQQRVGLFGHLYLKGLDYKGKAPTFEFSNSKGAVRVTKNADGSHVIHIPRKLETPDAERLFVNSLVDRLDEVRTGMSVAELGRKRDFLRNVLARGEEWENLPESHPLSKAHPKEIRTMLKALPEANQGKFLQQYEKVLNQEMLWSTRLGSEKAAARMVQRMGAKEWNARIVKEGKNWAVVDAAGKVYAKAGSIDLLMDEVLAKTMTKSDLELSAGMAGYYIKWNKDGTVTLIDPRGKVKPIEGANAAEAFRKANMPVHIPNRFAPRGVFINPAGELEMGFIGSSLVAKEMKQVNRFMAQFDSSAVKGGKTIKRTADGVIYKPLGKKFTVYDSNIEHTFEASNLAEANKYLNKGISDPKILEEVAHEKSLYIRKQGTGFSIIQGGQEITLKDEAALKYFLRQNPTPKDGPELVDVGGEVDEILNSNISTTRKGDFAPSDLSYLTYQTGKLRTLTKMGGMTMMRDYWIPKAMLESGHQDLAKMFREAQNGYRVGMRNYLTLKAEFERVFKQSDGKILPYERRVLLFDYMQAPEAERAALKKTMEITSEEVGMLDRMATILGKDPTQGLFARFIDDPNKFIFDYMTRLVKGRKKILQQGALANYAGKDMEFAKQIFGEGKVPRQIAFWARENRLMDILGEVEYERDILVALDAYAKRGAMFEAMREPWENIAKYMNGNRDAIPDVLYQNVDLWFKQVLGVPTDVDMKIVKDIGEDIMTKLGLNKTSDAFVKSNVLQTLYSLNYLATMAYRPWLPFRNMFQIYMTLGPRFGNFYVNEALRRSVIPDEVQRVYEHLQDIGNITDALPLYGEIVGEWNPLNKALKKGLRMYKDSDSWTRVVAYMTCEAQWDPALKAYKKGLINDAQFLERAGVSRIDPDVVEVVKGYLRKNEWQAALDEYAARVIDDTMFLYSTTAKPRFYTTNIVGRVFGQFGTWSSAYLANIIRGFRFGTPAQKAAFAARWLANGVALYGTFNALGIRANNFLPWVPLQFTGGPLYQMFNHGLQSVGTGYQARQSRQELAKLLPFNVWNAVFRGQPLNWNEVPTLIPGGYQVRSALRFVELARSGDYLRALEALSTAPISMEPMAVQEWLLDHLDDRTRTLTESFSGAGTGTISQTQPSIP